MRFLVRAATPCSSKCGRSIATMKSWILDLILPALVILHAVLVMSALYYPGLMDHDSMAIAEHARQQWTKNWHPVTFTWLWKITEDAGGNPRMLWLVQMCLAFVGVMLLSWSIGRLASRAWRLLAYLVLCSPPILFLFREVLKDTVMLAALVLLIGLFSVALTFNRARKINQWAPTSAAVLIASAMIAGGAIAMGSRHNGLFTVLPLAFATGFLLAPLHWCARAGFGTALTAGVVLGYVSFGHLARQGFPQGIVESRPVYSLLIYDIAGILANNTLAGGENDSPATAGLTPDEVQAAIVCYNSKQWDDLGRGDCGTKLHSRYIRALQDTSQLIDQWTAAILADPKAYITHRYKHMRTSLRWSCEACGDLNTSSQKTQFDRAWAGQSVGWVAQSYERFSLRFYSEFRPWMALGATIAVFIASLAALLLLCRTQGEKIDDTGGLFAASMVITGTSLFNYATLFFISVSSQFRYHYPIYAMLAIALLFFCAALANFRRGIWAMR